MAPQPQRSQRTPMTTDALIFDFDNHYYEAPDAFTRHQDRSLRYRGVRWADIDGRQPLLVGGTVNSYIANPTFDPVAKPGSLFDGSRGDPKQPHITEASGQTKPLPHGIASGREKDCKT